MLKNINSLLRNKSGFALVISGTLFLFIAGFWLFRGTIWTSADFQVMDHLYRHIVGSGHGPPMNDKIVHLDITDSTYHYFGHKDLNRQDLAQVNAILQDLGAEAVIYDIIFARPDAPETDSIFAASIAQTDRVYLPIAFELSEHPFDKAQDRPKPFQWQAGAAYERLRTDQLKKLKNAPAVTPETLPDFPSATYARMQADLFAASAYNSGHVSIKADPDGIYRHYQMLVKVDSLYFPALSLAVFLDHLGLTLADVKFERDNTGIANFSLPLSTQAGRLKFSTPDNQEIIIPLDAQGRTIIPYPQAWENAFDHITVHRLIESYKDVNLRGNLAELLEGRFVLIGDVSNGIADVGQTPLDDNVPLVAVHAALLNGLLNNCFYRPWSFWSNLAWIALFIACLTCVAVFRSVYALYGGGIAVILLTGGFAYYRLLHFEFFPIASVMGSLALAWAGLTVGLHIFATRRAGFIRNAFSHYVPETVVQELINHQDKLTLGGEERVVTVLFSDLAGFTAISEKLAPAMLTQLLNEYLTEMTNIILAEGGIVDKYLGDAIMAEFGIPLPVADHADRAVRAAVKMQRRLGELRREWAARELPELHCRIGINTGPMTVGNMGSQQVFDYTVIGDAVNLAARLESANKQYGTYLMISENTFQAMSANLARCRLLDYVRVKGKTIAVKLYEVYGLTNDEIPAVDLDYFQLYQNAFEAYLAKDFKQAGEQLTQALTLRPDDMAAKHLLERLKNLPVDPPDSVWDGAVSLTSK